MQDVDSFPTSVCTAYVAPPKYRDCLDRFRESGPPLDADHRVLMPTQEDLDDPGFKATRGGSYGNSASDATGRLGGFPSAVTWGVAFAWQGLAGWR